MPACLDSGVPATALCICGHTHRHHYEGKDHSGVCSNCSACNCTVFQLQEPKVLNSKRPSFEEIMKELIALQSRKGADYGSSGDPLVNIVSALEFGISPWVNAILRANDKMYRIATFVRKGKLQNESVEDSLVDLAVYAIHALRLYREENS